MAVLGDADSVLGFKGMGAVVYSCSNTQEATAALKDIYSNEKRDHFAVLFIVEDIAQKMVEVVESYKKKYFTPIITIIPGKSGSSGLQSEQIKKTIETAVGFDIFGQNK